MVRFFKNMQNSNFIAGEEASSTFTGESSEMVTAGEISRKGNRQHCRLSRCVPGQFNFTLLIIAHFFFCYTLQTNNEFFSGSHCKPCTSSDCFIAKDRQQQHNATYCRCGCSDSSIRVYPFTKCGRPTTTVYHPCKRRSQTLRFSILGIIRQQNFVNSVSLVSCQHDVVCHCDIKTS